VTRGAGRASAVGAHGEVELAPRRVRCVDPTGAGDAFVAGSLAALLAAGVTPASRAWADRAVWASVLRVGHMMGMKAVSQEGAVAGLVRLQRVRGALDALRRAPRGTI
jgi:sugar/nucleoside kinase (ribokinase family)